MSWVTSDTQINYFFWTKNGLLKQLLNVFDSSQQHKTFTLKNIKTSCSEKWKILRQSLFILECKTYPGAAARLQNGQKSFCDGCSMQDCPTFIRIASLSDEAVPCLRITLNVWTQLKHDKKAHILLVFFTFQSMPKNQNYYSCVAWMRKYTENVCAFVVSV